MEEWRIVKDYPIYSVSNLGNVKNNTTNKIMRPTIKGGYYNISLTNESYCKTFKVHRLVALAFIENPENKPDVNHIDKNKINNNLSNLNWMTRKENNIHRCQGIKMTSNKNKHVLRIDNNSNELLGKYSSIEEAGIWAYESGHTKTPHNGRNAIGNCLNGLSKVAYNFRWEYENKYEDLENEIWKEVIVEPMQNDKKYFVSNLGRFKNSSGMIMENYKVNENGYIRVYIYNKTYALHRLIAKAFIENPHNKEQVNHIDGVKLNNSLENLEWVTNTENQIHKYKTGLADKSKRKIIQYDLEMNELNKFNSIVEASQKLKIEVGGIKAVLYNKQKTTAGSFIFKYLE